MAGCCPSRDYQRLSNRRFARRLAGRYQKHGLDWRIHDLAADPGAVEPADLVVLHRVVCCYPDYERLLGAAADHARRGLVWQVAGLERVP
jgi:hypothetical protein